MRAADARALASTTQDQLVRRAGWAVAAEALSMLGGAYGRRVVVVAGKGNNGNDGRVAAAVLRRRGAAVAILDAADLPARIDPCDLVIDAAYGTGFAGTYRAPDLAPGARVLAVDIPSGVHGDTGAQSGRALAAERTVTLAALKPGLLMGEGAELAGTVSVADIGVPTWPAAIGLVDDDDLAALPGGLGPPTSGRARWRWWPAPRGWKGRPSCAPEAPPGPGRAWCGWGCPEAGLRRGPSKRSGWRCPPPAGPARCLRRWRAAGRW